LREVGLKPNQWRATVQIWTGKGASNWVSVRKTGKRGDEGKRKECTNGHGRREQKSDWRITNLDAERKLKVKRT